MSSSPSPSAGFKNFVELTPQGNGVLRVGNVVNGVNATVTDGQSDGSSDSIAVLGDISNERMFVVQDSTGRTSQPDMTYWGKSPDQQGVIGRIPSTKTATGFNYLMYTNNSYTAFTTIPASNFSQTSFALCFVSGTRILTARGEVAVEDLRQDDIAITASGRQRPIIWIGHRNLGGERPLAANQAPVRIRGGAFGAGLPTHDLALSSGHPILVGADANGEGGVLVPIMCLINGTTIAREAVERVTYWHIELDAHDILLAEGLPAESFLDLGCRAFFAEVSDHALHNPDFVPPGIPGRCRPVATDGPLVEAERRRLDAIFSQALVEQCAWADAFSFSLTAA